MSLISSDTISHIRQVNLKAVLNFELEKPNQNNRIYHEDCFNKLKDDFFPLYEKNKYKHGNWMGCITDIDPKLVIGTIQNPVIENGICTFDLTTAVFGKDNKSFLEDLPQPIKISPFSLGIESLNDDGTRDLKIHKMIYFFIADEHNQDQSNL